MSCFTNTLEPATKIPWQKPAKIAIKNSLKEKILILDIIYILDKAMPIDPIIIGILLSGTEDFFKKFPTKNKTGTNTKRSGLINLYIKFCIQKHPQSKKSEK